MKKKILITIWVIIVLGAIAFLIWTKCPFTGEGVQQTTNKQKETTSTYPECDTLDITIWPMTISACNVGSSIVGTGEEAYGEYFKREDALRACASGYHLPSVDERQIMVAGLRRENPSYTSRKWYGEVNFSMAWTKEDLKAFQERLKIPMAGQYSYDGTGSFRDQEADGRYRSSSSLPEEEVRNYAYILRFHQNAIDATDGKNRGSGLSVRCFKNYPPLTLTF